MSIDIILITDREIRRLNKKWFGNDRPTDVIAFGGRSLPFVRGGLGWGSHEIYISLDTARRQARERKITLKQELLRLSVHGLAHICGYNDLTLKDFCKMREVEWKLLVRSSVRQRRISLRLRL